MDEYVDRMLEEFLEETPALATLLQRGAKGGNTGPKETQNIHSTKGLHLSLSSEDLRVMKQFIDASFACHPHDFKSHTGMTTMTMGERAMQITMTRKQKLNSCSSTEAELIGVDDAITQVLWMKLFMEAQGYRIDKNIIYQDNKSSILLETNGKKSVGKRSCTLNIW